MGYDDSKKAFNPSTLWNSYMGTHYVNAGDEINIFIFEATVSSGQANGLHGTVHNVWDTYHNGEIATPPSTWYLEFNARVLLHEVFHNNGLWLHPFQSSEGCDDTPEIYPPCWGCWPPSAQASNNLMDYNGITNWSLSPCQICNLHEGLDPQFVVTSEDCAPINAFFAMPSVVCGQFSPTVWMQGSASYNENKHFIEIYQVPSLGSTDVIGGTYSSDWYSGEVGNVNLRTYMGYSFTCGKIYRIKLAVSNDCGDWDEQVRYVTFNCFCDEPAPDPPVHAFTVDPNPANGSITIGFDLSQNKEVTINIYNLYSGTFAKNVVSEQIFVQGQHQVQTNVQNLSEGLYFVRINDGEGFLTKQFQIQR